MSQSLLRGSYYFDSLTAGALTIPAGAVGDAQVIANAAIAATKLEHRQLNLYIQPHGTDVVSETQAIYITRTAGALVSVVVASPVGPAGGDKKYTLDVQRVRAGAAHTMLTGVIDYTNGTANWTVKEGIVDADYDDLQLDDIVQAVVTVSGTTGTQAQGLVCNIIVDELAL